MIAFTCIPQMWHQLWAPVSGTKPLKSVNNHTRSIVDFEMSHKGEQKSHKREGVLLETNNSEGLILSTWAV